MSGIILGKTHFYFSPTKILFGLESSKAAGKEIRELGGKKVVSISR